MTYAENLWLFSLLLAGIIVVPGMDMIFVIANGLTGGRRAGIAATSGIMLGGAFHTLFGTVAVTVLATLVPQLAGPMLIIGSAYMIWIGYTLAKAPSSSTASKPHTCTGRRAFSARVWSLPAEPEGLAVYPRRLSAVHATAIRALLAAGPRHGRAHPGPAGTGLWWPGNCRGERAGRAGLKPGITIWVGRAAGWLLVAVAVLMLVEGWRSW